MEGSNSDLMEAITSTMNCGRFIMKVSHFNIEEMIILRKILQNFIGLSDYDREENLPKLMGERFYYLFLMKILDKEYSSNSALLDTISTFFDAMESIFFTIQEYTRVWDTPAGHLGYIDPDYCYEELIPKIIESDDGFNLINGYLDNRGSYVSLELDKLLEIVNEYQKTLPKKEKEDQSGIGVIHLDSKYLTPLNIQDLDSIYLDIIQQILENRRFPTNKFYRIARITQFPSLFVADFSTIMPNIDSDVYFRFIIANSHDYPMLSTKIFQNIRYEPFLKINVKENVIENEEFFVTLFDMMNFLQIEPWI